MKHSKKIIFLILPVIIGFWLLGYYQSKAVQGFPYPAVVLDNIYSDLPELSDVNILIAGDTRGVELSKYGDYWRGFLQKGLSTPLKFASIARPGQSLIRTLAQIKKIKNLPPVIIYHGGGQEFLEEKIDFQTRQAIRHNINRYSQGEFRFWVNWKPWLSKILYKSFNQKFLGGEIVEYDHDRWSASVGLHREITYATFERHMRDLIGHLKMKGSRLILTTGPLNLKQSPEKNCGPPLNELLTKKFAQAKALQEKESFKEALELYKNLALSMRGQVFFHHGYGKLLMSMARYEDAREQFLLAHNYDCGAHGQGAIFNQIIRKLSLRSAIPLVDLDLILRGEFGPQERFNGDGFPQQEYYRKFIFLLSKRVGEILRL